MLRYLIDSRQKQAVNLLGAFPLHAACLHPDHPPRPLTYKTNQNFAARISRRRGQMCDKQKCGLRASCLPTVGRHGAGGGKAGEVRGEASASIAEMLCMRGCTKRASQPDGSARPAGQPSTARRVFNWCVRLQSTTTGASFSAARPRSRRRRRHGSAASRSAPPGAAPPPRF